MKLVKRFQSQLLFRKSYKVNRTLHFRPIIKLNFAFRPSKGFGAKPQLENLSHE